MEERRQRKFVPAGAVQHKTAGPYSPVVVVDARRLVVISGQVAVGPDGDVTGETIEEQTHSALENCRRQLATAGADFADVFKVNVYLRDLAEWSRFNAVYEALLPRPLPVRTAVQAGLLSDFRVEIEMWAVLNGSSPA
jgi:2-iminobutanoate/2-iminopropanoate deaminase